MIKHICDMCQKREATQHFKVKYRRFNWENVILCDPCYEQLIFIADKNVKENK